MRPLVSSSEVEADLRSLLVRAQHFESWLAEVGVAREEDLIVWNLVEVLYDLRSSEMRVARLLAEREPLRVLEGLDEHCLDVLDYLVRHWPQHLRPMQTALRARFGEATTQAAWSPRAPDPGSNVTSGLDRMILESDEFDTLVRAIDPRVQASASEGIRGFILGARKLHCWLTALFDMRMPELAPVALWSSGEFMQEVVLKQWCIAAQELQSLLQHYHPELRCVHEDSGPASEIP